MRQFLEGARRNPGKLSYGSPGNGSPHHLAMEMLKRATGVDVVHIAYKGAAPAVQDLIGGQVPLMLIDTAVALPQLKAGKIKALGVMTPTRLALLPNVPTMEEQGIANVVAYAWIGVVVPSGTPRELVTTLSTAIGAATRDAAVGATVERLRRRAARDHA